MKLQLVVVSSLETTSFGLALSLLLVSRKTLGHMYA